MLKNYMKRSIMLLGAAAVVASAGAEGAWVDVTHKYIKDAAYLPGWQGVIGATSNGVGEVWNGAFRLYQVLPDMEAGEYTLSVDAFYRCGNNDYAKAHMTSAEANKDLYCASIFINGEHKPVKGLFDGRETAPNGTDTANEAFAAGEYTNTITVQHPGGDMVIGIMNTGCYDDEWCCFDNFRLTSGGNDLTDKIVNNDFSQTINAKLSWDNHNYDNGEKTPDMQKDGAGGGTFRKCGGSPYNYGQQIELPAGKYRYGMLTFHRYGSTLNPDGTYYHHKSGAVTEPYGRVPRTPKDWFDANDYEEQVTYDHAYIFMSKNDAKPKDLNWSEDFGDLTEGEDVRTRIRDCWEICNGNYAEMPDNNPYGTSEEAKPAYETKNVCGYWHDSGNERESAAAFVANPEKWYQYVEFELTTTTKVWVGMGKNSNTSDGYYHPWADQTLQMFDEEAGVDNVTADLDADAPVEYFNLQGIRVANPENGIFIVKQGKKVSKQVIR